MLYKNRPTYNTYRKPIHRNIPDCREWIEEHTTVEQHQFGTFTLASHFLTLAQVWRTFLNLECTKQGGKSPRRKPNQLALEKVPTGSQAP